MKNAFERVVVVLLCLVLLQFKSIAQDKTSNSSYREQKFPVEQLKQDFSLLRKALEEAHPALYKFASKATMDSLFNAIDKSIEKEMSEAEFWTLIAPVFGKIGCGHTRIYPSDNYKKYLFSEGKIFPFDVKIIEGKLYVAQNLSSDSTIEIGSEIVSINKISSTNIVKEIFLRTWADGYNQTMRYRMLEQTFTIFYSLVIGESENYVLEIIAPGAKKSKLFTVPFISMSERKKISTAKSKKNINNRPVQIKISSGTLAAAVLTIKTLAPERIQQSGINFNMFIDSVFNEIETKKVKKLIIDLRDNGGGNPDLVRYLYACLASKEFNLMNYAVFKTNKRFDYFGDFKDTSVAGFYKLLPDKKGSYYWKDEKENWYGVFQPNKNNYGGKVIVLMNGGSFSSSGFFGSLVRYYKRGIIVGEESGGSFVCNDCHDNLVLPNTKIRTEIARCTFSVNLPDMKYDGHGIIPDHAIKTKAADLLTDKDVVLDFALELK